MMLSNNAFSPKVAVTIFFSLSDSWTEYVPLKILVAYASASAWLAIPPEMNVVPPAIVSLTVGELNNSPPK